METYSLKSTSCRNQLSIQDQGGRNITTLRRPSTWSYKTEFTYRDLDYTIKHSNAWQTRYALYGAGETLGHFRWKWNGGSVLELKSPNGDWHTFQLNTKGFMNFHFVLSNEYGETVMVVKPIINWHSFTYDFEIKEIYTPGKPVDIVLLLAMSAFCMSITMFNIGLSLGAGIGLALA